MSVMQIVLAATGMVLIICAGRAERNNPAKNGPIISVLWYALGGLICFASAWALSQVTVTGF